MKELYVKPIFLIEEFVPNKVVAACANNQSVSNALCFIGSKTETEKIITSVDGCTSAAKYIEKEELTYENVVYHLFGNSQSMVKGKSYSVPNDAVGVLVWCAKSSYSVSAWSDGGVHSAKDSVSNDGIHSDMGYHCHVLPVYGSNVQLS